MSRIITSRSEIPDAPLYVLANDSFMSDWGHAKGKTNTVILPCRDHEEARDVRDYADSRDEMRYVRIACNKPRLKTKTHLYSLLTRENARAWYPTD